MTERVEHQTSVPELRFPGFRGNWDTKQLQEICDIRQGGTPDTTKALYWNGTLAWATPTDLSRLTGTFISSSERKISEEGLAACSSLLLPEDSIILSTRAPIGYAAINLVPMAINQGCKGLTPHLDTDSYFLHQLISKHRVGLVALGAGNTFKELSSASLRAFQIAMPGVAEQRKIADCLESLDELIAAETEKLEALKRHKKALLQQLFPIEGETTPRLRFPQFSKAGDWFHGSVGELGDVITGTTPSTANRSFYGREVLFASPADIAGHRMLTETANGLSILGSQESRLVAQGSTLFVCIGSTIGKVAQNAEVCATNQQINAVVPDKSRFDPDFVYYLLLTKTKVVRDLAGKQAVPLVSKTVFCSVEVAFPRIDEQRAIAALMNELDHAQSASHYRLKSLRTHKAALMQQLFPSLEELDTPTE